MQGGEKAKKSPAKVSAFRPSELVNNSRFYILAFSVLLSLFIASYLRTSISGNTLYLIRVQQVFGFSALLFWYFALLATPLKTIFGKDGFMKQYLYDRRALGVSAAYFATLHMLTGLFGQLGGPAKLLLLPVRFQVAVVFGFTALLFLLLMAMTSFDKVIGWMTFPRWKWLHRLGYIGAILVLLHVWMIGTHLAYEWIRQCLFMMLALMAIVESWRVSKIVQKKSEGTNGKMIYVLFAAMSLLLIAGIYMLPKSVPNYRDDHVQTGMSH